MYYAFRPKFLECDEQDVHAVQTEQALDEAYVTIKPRRLSPVSLKTSAG